MMSYRPAVDEIGEQILEKHRMLIGESSLGVVRSWLDGTGIPLLPHLAYTSYLDTGPGVQALPIILPKDLHILQVHLHRFLHLSSRVSRHILVGHPRIKNTISAFLPEVLQSATCKHCHPRIRRDAGKNRLIDVLDRSEDYIPVDLWSLRSRFTTDNLLVP
jgi:hypothetical protein